MRSSLGKQILKKHVSVKGQSQCSDKDVLGAFGVDLWDIHQLHNLNGKGNEGISSFTLMHLWRLWSDSLGTMGTENRPELPFNHLTIYEFQISCSTHQFSVRRHLRHMSAKHFSLCRMPLSHSHLQIYITIDSQKQFIRKKKNVITTYSGEFRKPAPKFVLVFQ